MLAITGVAHVPLMAQHAPGRIDRHPIVDRQRVIINELDTLNPLTVGNGRFAVTVDVTGLQTFPATYRHGIPLGTFSEWGWHSFPNSSGYTIDQTLRYVASHGREVPYAIQWPAGTEEAAAADYLRQNPHRLPLGSVGWSIQLSDGRSAKPEDIQDIRQELDMWNGRIETNFTVEGIPVKVWTAARQDADVLVVKVSSPLLTAGRLALQVTYPYPTGEWLDAAADFDNKEQERLSANQIDERQWRIRRQIDSTVYYTAIQSSAPLAAVDSLPAGYRWSPARDSETWSVSLTYSPIPQHGVAPSVDTSLEAIGRDYHRYWNDGGIIDFSEVSDPRAAELERRMVLSRYLTHVNTSGSVPPQETGLTYNSWYGKPHLEMAWWHGVHFPLWGEPEVLQRYLDWYFTALPGAREIAERQGFAGVRWQKMTDAQGGETASSIGSHLLWQQPHPIYFAEMLYQLNPDPAFLRRYAPLVAESAAFMADFAFYDSSRRERVLGPGVIAAQERFGADTTFNTTFELAYWKWGLEVAQQWRERLGQERKDHWDRVLKELAPLPVQDGLYLAAASAPDSYTNEPYLTDHPSVLGAYGLLPATEGLDPATMARTLDTIWKIWNWEDTWGWDFPMTAMTATRLGQPERAVDALLMDVPKNIFLKNGHNYQRSNLRLYLPGNGGFLTALAMMAAGTEDTPPGSGFPPHWNVKWEGLRKMP